MNFKPSHINILGKIILFILLFLIIQIKVSSQFLEISTETGLSFEAGIVDTPNPTHFDFLNSGGGMAVGDYDQDGHLDVYVCRGNLGHNLLFRNKGDGTFEEISAKMGIDITGLYTSPMFIDLNGDGWLDLFMGGIEIRPVIFINNDGVLFTQESERFPSFKDNIQSASAADIDRDGDLDIIVSHWRTRTDKNYLFQNDGSGQYTDITEEAGLSGHISEDEAGFKYVFTPIFLDINDDSYPDLLFVSDFGRSQIWINDRNGQFIESTDRNIITDENGMGGCVGDIDNDGDMDWFVTSIWDPNGIVEGIPGSWGLSGNRMYINNGTGGFSDETGGLGLREGYWGWACSMADFNLDGYLDIIHTNGYGNHFINKDTIVHKEFLRDPTRLFLSENGENFVEVSEEYGLVDNLEGRSLVTFDFDNDGDEDVLILNVEGQSRFFRNENAAGNYCSFKLIGVGNNPFAIGSQITCYSGNSKFTRQITLNSNFTSHNPPEAHFGLGEINRIDSVFIRWSSGNESKFYDLEINKKYTFQEQSNTSVTTFDQNNSIKVYPTMLNINQDLTVQSTSSVESAVLISYDSKYIKPLINIGNMHFSLPPNIPKSGLYFVNIKTQNRYFFKKVFIRR